MYIKIMKEKQDLKTLRDGALAFVMSSWQVQEIEEKYPVKDYEKLVDQAFHKMTEGISPHPLMIRIGGQSGSGKSTQLMPAAREGFRAMGVTPVHIAVRNFVPFHPYCEEIRERYGEDMLRENTNGFALLLLFLTLEKLILEGYPILFEVTLLDPAFETYLSLLAKSRNYLINFHIIAVSRRQSDRWIEERRVFSDVEKNRKVAPTSSEYFFRSLPAALEALNKAKSQDKCFIWNGYDDAPVFAGTIGDSEVLNILESFRKKDFAPKPPETLRESKIEWFKNHYRK